MRALVALFRVPSAMVSSVILIDYYFQREFSADVLVDSSSE